MRAFASNSPQPCRYKYNVPLFAVLVVNCCCAFFTLYLYTWYFFFVSLVVRLLLYMCILYKCSTIFAFFVANCCCCALTLYVYSCVLFLFLAFLVRQTGRQLRDGDEGRGRPDQARGDGPADRLPCAALRGRDQGTLSKER